MKRRRTYTGRVWRHFAVILLHALVVLPKPARAQVIECVVPADSDGECATQLRRNPADQRITVRVTGHDTVSSRLVTFTASAGTVTPDTVRTDARGEATTYWFGPADASGVRVLARTTIGTRSIARGLVLRPPIAALRTTYRLEPVEDALTDTARGGHEYWYAERQLSKPAVVRILGPRTATECDTVRVLFTPASTGVQTPKVAYGTWVTRWASTQGAAHQCLARARWALGKEVGEHHLIASLAADSTKAVEFTARARSLPRVIAGLALNYVSGYDRASQAEQKFTVKRLTATGEVSYDSVSKATTLTKEDAQWVFAPTVGVDWPLKTDWEKVRVSVSASLTDVTNDWYTGFSILQAFQGYEHEGVGIDLHAVVQWSRRRVIENPGACASDAAACQAESRTRPVGAGALLTLSLDLISALKGAFGLK